MKVAFWSSVRGKSCVTSNLACMGILASLDSANRQRKTILFENHHIYGLVGINGSGKTLILKALAGYIKLDKGTVYQDNIQIRKRKNYIERAGVLIENPEFISHLSLLENLELVKQLCRHKKEIDLSYWISLYGLEKFTHTAYKNLSLGTKKKMALIQAFIDSPEILILDEPMNALDEKV